MDENGIGGEMGVGGGGCDTLFELSVLLVVVGALLFGDRRALHVADEVTAKFHTLSINHFPRLHLDHKFWRICIVQVGSHFSLVRYYF